MVLYYAQVIADVAPSPHETSGGDDFVRTDAGRVWDQEEGCESYDDCGTI